MKYTLEQLQEFTDAELSESILRKLHPEIEFVEVTLTNVYDGKNQLRGFGFDINNCNNWLDMGALANKHKISARCDGLGRVWAASSLLGEYTAYDKNELRAKAIVFLLMGF